MMWRCVVAMALVFLPLLAVYGLGYLGLIDLPESMTTGLPKQVLITAAFALIFALIAWGVARAINKNAG